MNNDNSNCNNISKIRVVPHFKGPASLCLAREEALFSLAVKQIKSHGSFDPIVGLYSFSKSSVILGYNQPMNEIDFSYCDEHNIQVTMRKTGGGSVFLSSEEMQYFYILPFNYSKEILRSVNSRILAGLNDAGFSPQLKLVNDHHVLRLNDTNSFVFDAQRFRPILDKEGIHQGSVLLHHGTMLVDEKDFGHMPNALNAPPELARKLQQGNVWLRNEMEIKTNRLIQVLQKNLPFDSSTYNKDLTSSELALAKTLHNNYYNDRNKFKGGSKAYGICYIPGPDYNMDNYRVTDQEVTVNA